MSRICSDKEKQQNNCLFLLIFALHVIPRGEFGMKIKFFLFAEFNFITSKFTIVFSKKTNKQTNKSSFHVFWNQDLILVQIVFLIKIVLKKFLKLTSLLLIVYFPICLLFEFKLLLFWFLFFQQLLTVFHSSSDIASLLFHPSFIIVCFCLLLFALLCWLPNNASWLLIASRLAREKIGKSEFKEQWKIKFAQIMQRRVIIARDALRKNETKQ